MNLSNRDILEFAIKYYKSGWSIFPAEGKQPAIQSWEQYKSQPADEEQIKSWFSNDNYNIALVTGRVSGLIAFDIDGEAAEDHFNLVVESLGDNEITSAIANTMRTKTGSGNLHVMIELKPEEFSNGDLIGNPLLWFSDKAKHNEIRLKGEGGYIIVPPSLHPNGNRYEFINQLQPATLSRKLLMKLLSSFKTQQNCKVKIAQAEKYNLDENVITNIVSALLSYYKVGIRNDFILYLSGWLRKQDVSFQSAQKIVELITEGDEEKYSRFQILSKTYKTENLAELKGYSGLFSLLTDIVGTEQKAEEILSSVKDLASKSEDQSKDAKKSNSKGPSKAKNIIDIALEQISELFVDEYDEPYAALLVNDHLEIIHLRSRRFRSWLANRFFMTTKMIADSQNIKDGINILSAKAVFGGNRKELNLRVTATVNGNDLTWYYDLTNKNWEFIRVTSKGWEIVNNLIIFRRFTNQLPQDYPSREYPHDIFEKFMKLLNIKGEENKLLLKCYIISLFIPYISKPVLMLYGEQGSAKSTFEELIKMLADPSIIKTLTFPKDINELIQQLSHNYIAYYDNVSRISDWISDLLCRAVTGGGFSKRVLFTDDDDYIYSLKRCVGFNGINLGATKADLLDRGIIIQLERLNKQSRRKVDDIWNEFEKIRPQLLGYIIDILVKVLKIRQQGIPINLKDLPRMADFAEYGEIISRCMGYNDKEFIKAYYANINLQTEEVLESSVVATTLRYFTSSRDEWRGSASQLLAELEEVAEYLKINTKSSSWPKTPNYLSRRLNEIRTNLREVGIVVDWSIDSSRKTRIIWIRKVSLVSSVSPEDPNQTLLLFENPGDGSSDTRSISPENREQDHAHNPVTRDSSDKNDTLPPSNGVIPEQENQTCKTIYRLGHSDTWACTLCKSTGDKWFMQKNSCKGHK